MVIKKLNNYAFIILGILSVLFISTLYFSSNENIVHADDVVHNHVDCSTCNGTGFISSSCTICNGTGSTGTPTTLSIGANVRNSILTLRIGYSWNYAKALKFSNNDDDFIAGYDTSVSGYGIFNNVSIAGSSIGPAEYNDYTFTMPDDKDYIITELDTSGGYVSGDFAPICSTCNGNGSSSSSCTICNGTGDKPCFTINYSNENDTLIDIGCAYNIPNPLPTPSISNKLFINWYYDSAYQNIATAGDVLTSNTILYAKWQDLYSITYHCQGGVEIEDDVGLLNFPNPLPTPIKTGYTFNGWCIDRLDTNLAVAGATMDRSVELYALWTANTYTIDCMNNGGVGIVPTEIYTYDVAKVLSMGNELSKNGYTLGGWNTSQDGLGTPYTLGQSVINLASNQDDEIYLYAVWEPNNYSLVYNTNGGNSITSGNTHILPNPLPTPTKEGKIFKGWYYDSTLQTVATAGDILTGNTTLYAKWNTAPSLTGNVSYITNVDNPITLVNIKVGLVANDLEDGLLTANITISSNVDNYPVDLDVKTYNVQFSIVDSMGDNALLNVTILVIDDVAPVITGTSNLELGMSTLTEVNTLKNNLQVSDNFDDVLNVIIDEDNYTPNYNRLGMYTIKYKVLDSSNNLFRFIQTIKVIDDVLPVITGPTSLLKKAEDTLTNGDIRRMITASDNIDGDITNEIQIKTDSFTGSGNQIGSYQIVFNVFDSSNNEGLLTINIKVAETMPNVLLVNNNELQVLNSKKLTNNEIVQVLVGAGVIASEGTRTITFTINNYVSNEETVGIYPVRLHYRSNLGDESDINLNIKVIEDVSTEDDITLFGSNSFLLKDGLFGLPIWSNIVIGVVAIGFLMVIFRRRYL